MCKNIILLLLLCTGLTCMYTYMFGRIVLISLYLYHCMTTVRDQVYHDGGYHLEELLSEIFHKS